MKVVTTFPGKRAGEMRNSGRFMGACSWLAGWIRAIGCDERGATAIEYVLILAGVFLAIVGAIGLYVAGVENMYDGIANNL